MSSGDKSCKDHLQKVNPKGQCNLVRDFKPYRGCLFIEAKAKRDSIGVSCFAKVASMEPFALFLITL